MDRIDKVLSNMGIGSRKEVKEILKKGVVTVDNIIIKNPKVQIDPEKAIIEIAGEQLVYKKNIYLMMNKPMGVISATYDNYDKTVIDILPDSYQHYNLYPVGRLDKDTLGLLILTNDGDLNHRVTSPKYHVDKVYYVRVDIELNEEHIEKFKSRIIIDDGYECLPANLKIINKTDTNSEAYVTIHEGKFHQVKRMFEAIGGKVLYLERVKFGPLTLDSKLDRGEVRELSNNELESLKNECYIS
ncbi:MAG: pseudouridine synthase [Clostridiaceae bacterium]